jgi:hypothetical protein
MDIVGSYVHPKYLDGGMVFQISWIMLGRGGLSFVVRCVRRIGYIRVTVQRDVPVASTQSLQSLSLSIDLTRSGHAM